MSQPINTEEYKPHKTITNEKMGKYILYVKLK